MTSVSKKIRVALAHHKEHFFKDFFASIGVFFVALPLCLGIAIACGVSPVLGIVSSIIGGIVVGLLAGVPLQVSGPAAGLISLVVEIIHGHGIESLGIIVLLAGVIQIVAGVCKLSPAFRSVSPSVIHGMLAGIGIIVLAAQFHVMIDDVPSDGAIQNLISIPQAIYKSLVPPEGTQPHIAAGIGVLTIMTIVCWKYLPRFMHVIPSALGAVAVAVMVSAAGHLPIHYVEIPDNFFQALVPLGLDKFTLLNKEYIWVSAFAMAFVSTAEAILCGTAVDAMAKGEQRSRSLYDREILAQGIGNTLAGFLGALPVTGMIVRSTANIEAGGITRMSAILHGVWLVVLALVFPHIIEMIPISCLAAILVYTGYKLVQPKIIKKLYVVGKWELFIYIITVVGVVGLNLLEGVIIGFILSSFRLLYSLSKLEVIQVRDELNNNIIHLFLHGSATFISLQALTNQLEHLPEGQSVVMHIEQLNYIDHACLEALSEFEARYEQTGGDFIIEWHELTGKHQPNTVVPVTQPNHSEGASHA